VELGILDAVCAAVLSSAVMLSISDALAAICLLGIVVVQRS